MPSASSYTPPRPTGRNTFQRILDRLQRTATCLLVWLLLEEALLKALWEKKELHLPTSSSLWTDLRPRGNVELDLNGQIVWEYYPSGKLDEIKKVANVRVTYLPTRDLFFRIFAPLNPSADQYTLNVLLSWTYRPRSRFYLAYNEQRSKGGKLLERIIMTKATYLWNL